MSLDPVYALDVSNDIADAADDAALIEVMEQYAQPLGGSVVSLGLMPRAQQGVSVLCPNGPKDYFSHYVERRYDLCSPVVARLKSSRKPFLWSSIPDDRAENPRGTQCMEEAHDAGLAEALCVPTRVEDALTGWVTIFSEPGEIETRSLSSLHFIALAGHQKFSALSSNHHVQHHELTPREREVLAWVAAGKTSEDVACLLSIAARTVEQHITAAAHKLGTSNRVQTVVAALRSGELDL